MTVRKYDENLSEGDTYRISVIEANGKNCIREDNFKDRLLDPYRDNTMRRYEYDYQISFTPFPTVEMITSACSAASSIEFFR
jgi:hypothetical protein